jgi:hypothetical protein
MPCPAVPHAIDQRDRRMKHFILGFLSGVVLLVAYWAWPFVGLHALAADLQARDAAALSQQVDVALLRQSLREQIVAAYQRDADRTGGLGLLGDAAPSAADAAIADPLVAQLVNSENLIELLNGETVSTSFGKISLTMGDLPATSLAAALRAWPGSDYWMDRFSIGLPAAALPAGQFRLRMQFLEGRWKLIGIDLPEKVRQRFAQNLAHKLP